MKKIIISSLFFISALSSCANEPVNFLPSNENTLNQIDLNSQSLNKIKNGFYSTGILKIKNTSDIEKTLTALKELKIKTSRESGNLDFVILQDKSEPTRIIIWEHFKDEASFNKHLESEHLKQFLGLNLVEFVVGYPAKIVA